MKCYRSIRRYFTFMHFRSKDQEIFIESTKVVLTMPLKSAKHRAKNVQNFKEEKNEDKKKQYPRVSEHYFGAGVSFE